VTGEPGHRASRTARMVAAFRAWGMRQCPGLFEDPYATALGGDDGEADARIYVEAHPAMPLYMALRTKALDDEARAAIHRGARQVVVLGAGLDTRAARLASPGVTFFEVDQPASQADKRARLQAIGYPEGVARYVECDFSRDDFLERLTASGFDRGTPTFFVWEGVVYYLTEAAVRATLRKVASCERTTSIALDVVGKRFVAGQLPGEKDRAARQLVADMGEPLHFGTDDPLPLLFEEGFRQVTVTSFDELALRYTATYDRDRKMRFQSLVLATIAPHPAAGG
jgi:methyltransferase (TIGR00027 family)